MTLFNVQSILDTKKKLGQDFDCGVELIYWTKISWQF